MKFQNSSIHGFKVMLCIKKRGERMDGRTDGRKDGRMDNPEAICPSNFFEVGGIKRKKRKIKKGSGARLYKCIWPTQIGKQI